MVLSIGEAVHSNRADLAGVDRPACVPGGTAAESEAVVALVGVLVRCWPVGVPSSGRGDLMASTELKCIRLLASEPWIEEGVLDSKDGNLKGGGET